MGRRLAAVLALLVFGSDPVAQVPARPRVQASDLRYLGAFSVPAACGSGRTLAYGGKGLSRSPRGLWIGGHDAQPPAVAEISIPAIGGTAQVLTPCTPVPHVEQVTPNETRLGGTLTWGSEVLVSIYGYYDASGSITRSHMAYSLNTGTAAPFVQVGTGGGRVAGYMTAVPAEWMAALGCSALTGQGAIAIISRSNYGPGLTCFDPALVSRGQPVPGVDLLRFPDLARTADTWSGPSLIFNASTAIGGVAFPPGTSSVLFVTRQGTTTPCYGDAARCANTGGSPYAGYHAAPYLTQVVAYDAADLVAVRQGAKQPWEPRPYARWPLPELGGTIQSATYDAVAARLYVTTAYGDHPRVHVYALDVRATPEPTPETFTASVTVPVGARQVTISVPATIADTVLSVPLTVDVPAGTTTATVTCRRPVGGAWQCEVP